MKKPQTQKTKPVTLDQIVSRGSKNEDFFNSLLKAPVATLKNNSLKLSAADGKKLKTLITKARGVKSGTVADLNKHFNRLGLKPTQHRTCQNEADWAP